jgi:predicted dehydrogenase
MEKRESKGKTSITRRDILKALATVPVFGALGFGAFKKHEWQKTSIGRSRKNASLLNDLGYSTDSPTIPIRFKNDKSQLIRLGLVGFGIRGSQLAKACGFEHPTSLSKLKKAAQDNPNDTRYSDFMEQENLNIQITGVCEVYNVRAKEALETANNIKRQSTEESGGKTEGNCKLYRNYREMLASSDIDAILIATPDHWHATMAMDVALAGKHVYSEKPFTLTVEEAFRAREIIRNSNVVFQLGHQNRQTESYNKARELIRAGILGKVSLIETNTNRNSKDGAWQIDLDPRANKGNIDWKEFSGPAPLHPFSPERYFRWKLWWDYATGISGNLFTHDWDCINQIFDCGIPYSASASGGIYFYKDGREIPDVYTCTYEYPEQDMSLIFSATLASDKPRGKVIMGSDGYMELGNILKMYPDPESKKYAELLQKNILQTNKPALVFPADSPIIDGVSSATSAYYIASGLVNTRRNGKTVDTTTLHIKEWLQCIREGITPSCPVDLAFQEAITAHMGTLSYREKRMIFWDKEKEKIVRG